MEMCIRDRSDIEQTYGGRSGIDWQDKIFGGSALTQSHNLSLSTGTEKTPVSYTHLDVYKRQVYGWMAEK